MEDKKQKSSAEIVIEKAITRRAEVRVSDFHKEFDEFTRRWGLPHSVKFDGLTKYTPQALLKNFEAQETEKFLLQAESMRGYFE